MPALENAAVRSASFWVSPDFLIPRRFIDCTLFTLLVFDARLSGPCGATLQDFAGSVKIRDV